MSLSRRHPIVLLMRKIKIPTFFFFILCLQSLNAQQPQRLSSVPVDPDVRYGKLANGLTYYIRHNDLPKERADFYIVQNVGSIQEEEHQRGLAHFLEHMAFNGTKHFPYEEGRSITDFAESLGMQMGTNLNASTGFDQTIYTLVDVPTTRPSIVDSCLLILHDWSSFITLADSLIEKERNVIREEWRARSDAESRLWEQQLPKMYPGSRYAARLPIGTIEVIDHFKPDELRAYYKKWYRPDLQAVIIVGDVDVDEVEARIKSMFADIPAPTAPAKREYEPVPDNKEPLVSIAKDKEATQIVLSIYYKHDRLSDEMNETKAGLEQGYVRAIVGSIMDERFGDIVQKADPPFVYAYSGDGDYMIARTKDAWTSAALVKPNELDVALQALVVETNKVKKYGFTAAEYQRARTNLLKQFESLYNERDKQRNGSYVEEYVRHFTTRDPIPDIETEYELIREIASSMTVEDVNEAVKPMIGEENIVIGLTGPDKDDIVYPTEEELLAKFREAQAIPVEPNREETFGKELISFLPAPGEITKTEEDPKFGATIYTLGNGVRVVLKPTEHKKDEILMYGSSNGGHTLFGDDDYINIQLFNVVSALGGLGDFSATEIEKMLAGKNVSCGAYLDSESEHLSGSAVPSDIRTLFELIYLTMTSPHKDREAYDSFMERLRSQLENRKLDPMTAFGDTLTKTMYGEHPRIKRLDEKNLSQADYDRILEMYKERYADASDFTFTFVGAIDKDSMIPMMKQYLATLPSLGREERGDTVRIPAPRKGVYGNRFHRAMETPKTSIYNEYFGEMNYDSESLLTATMLRQILDIVFMEKIREKEGGTYSVSTSIEISAFPQGYTTLRVYFDTDPNKADNMNRIVHEELQRMATQGPRRIDFVKTSDNLLKSYEENLTENGYWVNILDEYYHRGYDRHTDFQHTLKQITPAMIQRFAKKLLEQGNHCEIIMEP